MSEQELSLLEGLRIPVAIVTQTGGISYRNKIFRDTFGSEAEAWIITAARSVGGERGWLQGFFIAEEGHALDVDFSGRTYHVEKVQASMPEGSVALAFEDVTRQREVEQAKSDFTSMIVHDLRGPLSGIQGTLEFVLGNDASRLEALQEELLREASRESERMMSLINELLDFSKIESGNFVVESDSVRIAGVLKRAVISLQSVASRDNVYLLSAHPLDLPNTSGSVEKLTQAVINLISNSLKFTPKKGIISVGAQVVRDSKGPEAILITVTDSGVGIKQDQLSSIFLKYKQTANKSFRGGGGTGLGLYIVKQIVEAHGGAVSVASIEGIGTSMVMRLPIRRAA